MAVQEAIHSTRLRFCIMPVYDHIGPTLELKTYFNRRNYFYHSGRHILWTSWHFNFFSHIHVSESRDFRRFKKCSLKIQTDPILVPKTLIMGPWNSYNLINGLMHILTMHLIYRSKSRSKNSFWRFFENLSI